MLAKVKLWAIAILGGLSTVLFALFKIKQSELEVAEEKNKIHEANDDLQEKKEQADEKELKQFWKEKKEIDDEKDSKVKQANKGLNSRPLSPLSIKLLQRSRKKRTNPPSP